VSFRTRRFWFGFVEISKLQLQQAVDTHRSQVTALGQIFTALVIGDVTMLGFAAQYKLAILVASQVDSL
jgi:hypothetical protein